MSTTGGPEIVTNDLFLALDASNPKSYPGVENTITDLSGNGNNGTLVNGVGYSTDNKGSLIFDGGDDYVNVSITKSATCTFTSWASTSLTSVSSLVDMLFNAGQNNRGPDLFFFSSKISWNTWNSAANPFCDMPSFVVDGNFHYYVVVCDETTETATLYIDGTNYGTASHAANLEQARLLESNKLIIGNAPGTYGWQGNISNFKVYNRALSADEVLQNYNAQKNKFVS